MTLLRILLLTLLACTMPATALAAAIHEGLCGRSAPVTQPDHAMHAGHTMHLQQQSADGQQASACQCGCACAGIAHCGASAGVSVADARATLSFGGVPPCPSTHRPGHALAGFSFDVLRPPSMS